MLHPRTRRSQQPALRSRDPPTRRRDPRWVAPSTLREAKSACARKSATLGTIGAPRRQRVFPRRTWHPSRDSVKRSVQWLAGRLRSSCGSRRRRRSARPGSPRRRSWRRPVTVREVFDDLRLHRKIAYTTVMTVMDNLLMLAQAPPAASKPKAAGRGSRRNRIDDQPPP
jgi:hypothetical protein